MGTDCSQLPSQLLSAGMVSLPSVTNPGLDVKVAEKDHHKSNFKFPSFKKIERKESDRQDQCLRIAR